MWPALQSIWHFIFSPSSLPVAVGAVAVAVAILEPKFLDAITDLRKWAICTAVVAFSCTGLLAHGYKNGLAEKQRQWDAALVTETAAGDAARSDAVRTVGPLSTSRELFRSDPNNRDRGKQPVGK